MRGNFRFCTESRVLCSREKAAFFLFVLPPATAVVINTKMKQRRGLTSAALLTSIVFTLLLVNVKSFAPLAANHRLSASTIVQLRSSRLGDIAGIVYEEPVFRPPAEWRSLILQVTIGCSWNRCTFCEMYQEKTFRAKPIADIAQDLDDVVASGAADYVRDVFLADGDAMTLPTGQLEHILELIKDRLPRVRRISSYCLPRNIRGENVEALTKLRSKGLSLVYVGCESGDDVVLSAVSKGETFDSSLDALKKLKDAGIKRSVMILIGLGGREHSERHAKRSAALCNEAKPEYLSVLTTSFPRGKGRVGMGYENNEDSKESFLELTPREGLAELETFLESIHMPRNGKTIFRSDHASNYLVLKGRLGRDRDRMLQELRDILDASPEEDEKNLRPEWARGL